MELVNVKEIEILENDPNKEERIEREELIKNLSKLTPREEMIIRLRWGLDDEKSRTMEEVAVLFNISRERVRQLEATATRKLRCYARDKKAPPEPKS